MANRNNYSISLDFLDHLDSSALSEEIRTSSILTVLDRIDTAGDVCSIWFPIVLPAPEKSALDALVAAHGLKTARRERSAAIDARTRKLISDGGFVFSGRKFSLSTDALSNLNSLDQSRLDALLVYPINVNTFDNSGVLALANAVDVHAMFLAALGGRRAHLDSGTALKTQVRAAATVAAVDAIVDPR